MRVIITCLATVVALSGPMLPADAAQKVRFNRDVRPILSNNCFECHGFDPKTREADLRLDTRAGALAELESGEGRAIVPGKLDQSVLLVRITSHDVDERMPPADSGKKLTAAEIETLRQWISQGAEYERHWAFATPRAAPLPQVEMSEWPRNMIDRFLLARLEREGLAPSPEADRRTLIRRVALDVTGLPPTRDEIRKFASDKSPDAYEQMVDRYLASPRYGEHMARYWLDLARYADTNGYQYDTERTMWVWRDWVINAYNQNMRFDQFTVEQLAGDLLPEAKPQQVLATGFNRNHPITIEGGIIDEEYRTEYVLDRLVTTSTAWLGLTMGCARCHDHKFDPISQKDFYQLSAFFNQVPERGMRGFTPNATIASPLAKAQNTETLAKIAALKQSLATIQRAVDDTAIDRRAREIATSSTAGWSVLDPHRMNSSGGSTLVKQTDRSVLASGTNPAKDVYEIAARTDQTGLTAVRLQCLTDSSLPGGGPGRHSNSNFVLSEFELVAVSVKDPTKKQPVKFARATADYSQANYNVRSAIDGVSTGNAGWAVDGPTRKKRATAVFYASAPFGFEGGTELVFLMKHQASFGSHGVGRPRLSATLDDPATLTGDKTPAEIHRIAKKQATKRTDAETAELRTFVTAERAAKAKAIAARIASLFKADAKKFPPTMVMSDMSKPRATHILNLGQYDRKGDVISPDVPASLLPMPGDAPKNRLGLARWLTSPQHPLTARVAVNRYWQRIFGTGLVKTAEDFGTQGEWPSHPELLDTLATKFVADGWDVKAIQRLMLTSAAYRQSARVSAELIERDPANRLLARGPRFRLDAEQIRDQALAASGLLVNQLGGPSVYPYQPKGLWLELNNRPGYSKAYKAGSGDDLYRRSLYTFWKRTVPSPMLKTFDAPEREFCTVARSRTNTPLQALLLLQGPQFVEAARHLAQRMIVQGGDDLDARLAIGFELVTARQPTAREAAILTRVYRQRLSAFEQNPTATAKMLAVGDSPRDKKLNAAEHAAWMEVARLLLNLDEAITRG